MTIHPTAVVEDGARLAGNITIGPYCTVGPHVTLADGVVLDSHVAVAGRTRVKVALLGPKGRPRRLSAALRDKMLPYLAARA